MKVPGFIFGLLTYTLAFAEPCEFDVSLSGVDVRCYGDSTGQVTVNIQQIGSFTGPYVIQWFDGDDRAFRDDLPAGTHFVKVTDALGCFVNEFITIGQPQPLQLSLAVTHVDCFGAATGSINLTRTGGVTPYDFQWSNSDDTEDISTLVAGGYSVLVTDGNGCQASAMATITQPPALGIAPTVIPVKCYNGSDGQVKTEVFGGVTPYSYSWSPTGDTIRNIINLRAGGHTLTVTDDHNCTLIQTINVPQPLPFNVEFEVTDLDCFESQDGEILAQVSGGTPGYSYEWANADVVLGDTTNHPTGLVSDYHVLTVTDSNKCVFKDSVFVDQPTPLILNLDQTPASCFNEPDGSIDMTTSGGTVPYQILWSNGEMTEDISGLLSDIYEVVVTDIRGCTGYAEIFVDQPDSLDFGFFISEVSCKDQDDGSISLDPMGGTPAYSVSWSNGSNEFEITDLLGGDYSVTLTDANSCLYEATFTVETNPRDCITRISIPNTFTPNGDNINDLWVIKNYEVYPNISVKVFNKWGKIIYNSIGYDTPWNGVYHGQGVEAGTYYYVVNLNNGDQPFTGILTIIR